MFCQQRESRFAVPRVQAAEVFAADVAAGRVPSIRAIRSRLRVGQPRAQQVRAYLAALCDGY